MAFITIDGKQIEYEWVGEQVDSIRPKLIFLHEGLGCIALWRDYPARLAAATGCTALVYSRHGYGNSDACELPRTPRYLHHEAYAILPKLLAELDVGTHILIGHSDGGTISLLYASNGAPNSLLGVITEAAHVFNEQLSVESIKVAKQAFETGGLAQRLAKYHANVEAAFWGWCNAWLSAEFATWNIEAALPNIRVPALVLQGADDQYGTTAQVDAIVAGIGTQLATPILLQQCQHTPHYEQPDKTLTLMTEFVLARIAHKL